MSRGGTATTDSRARVLPRWAGLAPNTASFAIMRTSFRSFLAAVQRHLLWLLIATYALGAWAPRLGLALGSVRLGAIRLPAQSTHRVTLPACLLAYLLVVAGLGVKGNELREVLRHWRALLLALVCKAAYPIAFVVAVAWPISRWHDPAEGQSLLAGLAILGAMPVAGASTAWSQNAGGALSMSLALVLGSIVLSPLVMPLTLHAAGLVTLGDYSEDLHELADGGLGGFVLVTVVAPALIGLALRFAIGAKRADRVLPALKLGNVAVLLALNYANAAAALPEVARHPDWDFLALVVAVTVAMGLGAFAGGLLLARSTRISVAQRTSVLFGVGMSNNGTGFALAAAALGAHALVLLPILFYNLVQQMLAAAFDRWVARRAVAGAKPG